MAAEFNISGLPKFVRTTEAKYAALASKDANTLYYVTDAGARHFYVGSHRYSWQLRLVSAEPAAASAETGVLYFNTATGDAYVFDGAAVRTLGGSSAALAGKVNRISGDVAEGHLVVASDATGVNVRTGGVSVKSAGALADGDTAAIPTGALVKSYVDAKVAALGSVIRIKGTVADSSALPASGNQVGDIWIATADGSEWLCTDGSGSGTWEKIGPVIDLTAIENALDGKLDAMSGAAANDGELVVVASAGAAVAMSGFKVRSSGDLSASDSALVPTGEVVHSAIADGLGLLAWREL